MNKILGRVIGFAEPWFLPFNASLENSGGGPGVYYYIDDMLGSSRTIVQDGQTSACYEADFYPFGGERDINVSCVQNYKFEGKERDPETQNDDFGARYYSNRFGRWLSADWSSIPEPVPYANLTNPQTLNLYAMVSDNPETFADLDGHLGCGFLWLGTCQQTPPPSPPTPPAAPSNPVYSNADQAGAAAARLDQQQQKKSGAENASSVYTVGPGYSYTDPVTQGQKTTVDPNNTTGVPKTKTVDLKDAPIPHGTQLVGESHSHPNQVGPSGEDIQRTHDMTILGYKHPDFQASYVGLPNGDVVRIDANTLEETTFRPGEP